MSNNYYTIIVQFKSAPGKEKELEAFLSSIINIALQSPGCIKHDLHRSIDDPSVFMFYENWIDKDAHERHIARAEVQEWRSKLDSFLDEKYQACFWEKIN